MKVLFKLFNNIHNLVTIFLIIFIITYEKGIKTYEKGKILIQILSAIKVRRQFFYGKWQFFTVVMDSLGAYMFTKTKVSQ